MCSTTVGPTGVLEVHLSKEEAQCAPHLSEERWNTGCEVGHDPTDSEILKHYAREHAGLPKGAGFQVVIDHRATSY